MIGGLLPGYENNRRYAHRLVADLGEQAMAVQPAAGLNHPSWVIGHLAVTSDRVVAHLLLGLERVLDEAWDQRFSPASAPRTEPGLYAEKGDLLAAYDSVHQRVESALRGLPAERFADPTPIERFADRFPTMGASLAYVMLAHEAVHLGQLSAWRRLQGLPAV